MNGFDTIRTRPLAADLSATGWIGGNDGENRVVAILTAERIGPGFNSVSGILDCHQQYRVGTYVLDFAWPKLKIALEADGSVHRTADRYERDRERDAWLRGQGWLVFRVDTARRSGVGAQIRRVLSVVRAMARS